MENNSKKVKRTVLSSMEEVISLAKKYSLEPEFYEKGRETERDTLLQEV